MMGTVLSYDLPIVQPRTPEEVLKIRREYEDERTSLSLLWNEVAEKVESKIKSGFEANEAALRVWERELLPQFNEFRHRLRSEKTGRFAQTLVKLLEIDAGWLTPKFFSQIAKALFGVAGEMAKDTESNKEQAVVAQVGIFV